MDREESQSAVESSQQVCQIACSRGPLPLPSTITTIKKIIHWGNVSISSDFFPHPRPLPPACLPRLSDRGEAGIMGGVRGRVIFPLRDCPGLTQLLLQPKIPFPDGVDRRIDTQLHDEGGEDAADHWCGNALHHIGASTC